MLFKSTLLRQLRKVAKMLKTKVCQNRPRSPSQEVRYRLLVGPLPRCIGNGHA